MQEPGKGLVTVVCNFLLSTPTSFDWVGFWLIKNGDHTSGKTRLFFCCSGSNSHSNEPCHLPFAVSKKKYDDILKNIFSLICL